MTQKQPERLEHLPTGWWGWVIEHILVVTIIVAALVATTIITFKDRIFSEPAVKDPKAAQPVEPE